MYTTFYAYSYIPIHGMKVSIDPDYQRYIYYKNEHNVFLMARRAIPIIAFHRVNVYILFIYVSLARLCIVYVSCFIPGVLVN